MWLANAIISFAFGYLGIGVIFSVWMLTLGLRRIDPVAQQAGVGFKLMILPGLCLLWPRWPWMLWQKRMGKLQA